VNYWDHHGLLFLVALALFPRLTCLFAVATPFGWLHWLGWLFAPHILVAVLATVMYRETNPVLVVIAWLFAVCGTGAESKTVASSRHSTA
jgi:Na+/proline symporter